MHFYLHPFSLSRCLLKSELSTKGILIIKRRGEVEEEKKRSTRGLKDTAEENDEGSPEKIN